MQEFDRLLDRVLSDDANPGLPEGFSMRFEQRLRAEKETTMNDVAWTGDLGFATVLGRRNESRSWGFWGAVMAHGFALALIVLLVSQRMAVVAPAKAVQASLLETPPPPLPPKLSAAGGGGGQKGPAPVSQGAPPKFAAEQIVPPKAPPLEEAKIHVEPTVNVQPDLKMAKNDMPNIGMPTSPLVGTSMGNGKGSGLGSGTGNGMGVGSGGNTGGGVYTIGGGVSAPRVIFQPDPEFTEEARKAKVSGNVLVAMQVDPTGHATHVHVLRGIGYGLDEKAAEAVREYRFKPAMKDGKPVTVQMNVEVTFTIF